MENNETLLDKLRLSNAGIQIEAANIIEQLQSYLELYEYALERISAAGPHVEEIDCCQEWSNKADIFTHGYKIGLSDGGDAARGALKGISLEKSQRRTNHD